MDCEKCKGCIFFESWYHGGSDISHTCWWTLKEPDEVGESECNRKTEDQR